LIFSILGEFFFVLVLKNAPFPGQKGGTGTGRSGGFGYQEFAAGNILDGKHKK
jgi:hypothetical protein